MIERNPTWLAAHLDDHPPVTDTASRIVDLSWFAWLALVALTVRMPRERVTVSIGGPTGV